VKRRGFLKYTGVGVVAGAGMAAAPFVRADSPRLHWRLATSWPVSLDTIFGGAQRVAERVSQLTNGRFQIRVYSGGEIVGGLQVLDAVSQGTVQLGHTASYYYIGKAPSLAFDTTLPFGFTARQQYAWQTEAGGNEMLNKEVFADFNVVSLPAGNTGCQMGGWFRKPVPDLASLKAIKMRIPGFGGKVMARMGVNVQTLAAAEIYPALERGVIDATEWIGPYDDEKLGFYQVAKYYYAPSWWEPNTQLSLYINRKAWESLPKEYQQAVSTAAAEANQEMLAKYDARNPQALKRLLAKGVQLETFGTDILKSAQGHAMDIYGELNGKDSTWRKIYDHWIKFRNTEFAWLNSNEMRYMDFVLAHASLKDL
jgi:TRAP-type mannitol/chloroaromatic compound transport system substrate-binding protein